ncbi:MAG: hypothetical protein U0414_41410 [Polyangiaceae bacterium]
MGARVAVAAIGLAGCAAPVQNGSIIVLPGATERLIAAMHYGFDGVGEAKPSASVTQITSREQLAEGPSATGKVGDWILENGGVVVVIADVDGSARSGTLVDVARNPRRRDAVAAFETRVLGEPVRYTTIKSGTDEALGSAFVEVSGTAGALVVSTRYDVAPDLDAVLVHTSFTRAAGASPDGALDVSDRLASDGARAACEGSHCATFAAAQSYVMKPLMDDGAVATAGSDGSVVVGLAPSTVPEGAYVYSRLVAPLERPDSLALAAALSAADGRQLGEVQIELSPERWSKDRAVAPGTFVFTPSKAGAPVELSLGGALHAGDLVTVKIPAGGWSVAFANDGYWTTEKAHVDVRPGKMASVFVPAERRPTPASAPLLP